MGCRCDGGGACRWRDNGWSAWQSQPNSPKKKTCTHAHNHTLNHHHPTRACTHTTTTATHTHTSPPEPELLRRLASRAHAAAAAAGRRQPLAGQARLLKVRHQVLSCHGEGAACGQGPAGTRSHSRNDCGRRGCSRLAAPRHRRAARALRQVRTQPGQARSICAALVAGAPHVYRSRCGRSCGCNIKEKYKEKLWCDLRPTCSSSRLPAGRLPGRTPAQPAGCTRCRLQSRGRDGRGHGRVAGGKGRRRHGPGGSEEGRRRRSAWCMAWGRAGKVRREAGGSTAGWPPGRTKRSCRGRATGAERQDRRRAPPSGKARVARM